MSLTVSVVICTYNRPGPLRRAVASARAQALPPGRGAELLVVDNSPDRNAEALVEALAADPAPGLLPLRYLSVTEPNVSLARNAGVAATTGRYLVFLDDDECCEGPGWLDALVSVAEATGADAVFGPVLPDFPDGPPAWDPEGRAYTRNPPLPDGAPLPLAHDQAASGRWIGTGNSLLRRETCLPPGAVPFDPALGPVGGEDHDLFLRLDAAGRRFAWCASAPVREEVPGPRTSFAYFLRWSFRSGQHWAGSAVRRSRSPALTAAWLALRAIAQIGVVGAAWAVSRATGRGTQARALKLAETAGKLAWWRLPLAR